MAGHDSQVDAAENYRRFSTEAGARSPAYAALAEAVAAEEDILGFLVRLPAEKRQPNLLFAAARYLLGVPADIHALRGLVRDRADELAGIIRTRRTQTNEPARCATLLPAMVGLAEPLALLEVGAAAGLTLLPDYYSYDYAGHRLQGADPQAPILTCQPRGPVPLPERLPTVAWRAGIDLNPLDASQPDDAHWLECLLWPGEAGRETRLNAALATARRHRPPVHRGDLVDQLDRVAAGSPSHATLVVYHSAVLAYADPDKRRAFAAAVTALDAIWLSNEAPGIIELPTSTPADADDNCFNLVRDGRQVLARTDSHGDWIEWVA
jgi:hypothetical protein